MASTSVTDASEWGWQMSSTGERPKPDLDLSRYVDEAPDHDPLDSLRRLSKEDIAVLLKAGIDPDEAQRSGSFFQMDHSVVQCRVQAPGVEFMSIKDALEKFDGLSEYWWKVLSPDKDAYTSRADQHLDNGYFIRVAPGASVDYPLQACMYLSADRLAQDVHNIVVAEEGSRLHLITGCATAAHVRSGLHVGVSEFYVKKGATVIFTMIHNWPEEMAVRPRTGIIVEEGGTYISNYVCLAAAQDLQSYPTAWLRGRGAVATFNSVILARRDSLFDSGSRIVMEADDCRGDIISRTVSVGGTVIARGHIVGAANRIKAHLECKGLLLSDEGVIHAIPELEGRRSDVEMTHEAAVGKIARDEIEYLMARGLSETEATGLIIRGFLSLDIAGLPPALKTELDRMIAETERAL